VLLHQVHEGAQLQARDVGPATASLHLLQQIEEKIAIGGKAAAERAILNAAVELLHLAQQGQQGLRTPARSAASASMRSSLSLSCCCWWSVRPMERGACLA
jgi:hypothetical protein